MKEPDNSEDVENFEIDDGAGLYPNESFKFKMKFIKQKTTILTKNSQELIQACLKG